MYLKLGFAVCFAAVLSLAQPQSRAIEDKVSAQVLARASSEWSYLQDSIRAATFTRSTQQPHERIAQAMAMRHAAATARQYYLSHPIDPNSLIARKSEAILALRGIVSDDAAYEAQACKIAEAYCADSGVPESDRFEVDLLLENVTAKRESVEPGEKYLQRERSAEKLIRKYSTVSEAYYHYAAIARASEMSVAVRMASRLLSEPNTPAEAQADARDLLDHKALVGKPIQSQLRDASGAPIPWSKNCTVIIYFCAAESIPRLQALSNGKQKRMQQILYVVDRVTPDLVEAVKMNAPTEGTLCTVGNPTGPAPGIFRPRHRPWIIVVDRDSKLVGFGPPDELGSLLRQSGR